MRSKGGVDLIQALRLVGWLLRRVQVGKIGSASGVGESASRQLKELVAVLLENLSMQKSPAWRSCLAGQPGV